MKLLVPDYHGKLSQRKSIVLPRGHGAAGCRRWRPRVRPAGCPPFHRGWRARGEAMIEGAWYEPTQFHDFAWFALT